MPKRPDKLTKFERLCGPVERATFRISASTESDASPHGDITGVLYPSCGLASGERRPHVLSLKHDYTNGHITLTQDQGATLAMELAKLFLTPKETD